MPQKLLVLPRRDRSLPFAYPGSKAHLMRKINGSLPTHKGYLSVFGGSGADILYKDEFRDATEIWNDTNDWLVNLFRLLKVPAWLDQLDGLIKRTSFSRAEATDAVAVLYNTNPPAWVKEYPREVALAWAFITSHNLLRLDGLYRPSNQVHFKADFQNQDNRLGWESVPYYLRSFAQRFRRVQIENRDWRRVLDYAHPGWLVFVDPPYLGASPTLYKSILTEADHDELAERLAKLKDCRVILTGYPTPVYDRHLSGWMRYDNIRHNQMRMRNSNKNKVIERVWVNFAEPRLPLEVS